MRAKLYAFIVAAMEKAILVGSGLEMGVARAQEDDEHGPSPHRALRELSKIRRADAIAKMLSDDLVWITRVGAKTDKAAMIAAFRAHRTTSPNSSDQQRVRVYGSIGVVFMSELCREREQHGNHRGMEQRSSHGS